MLRFLPDFGVPDDNNLAERDLCMMKVQQKVPGTCCSEAGVMGFCLIRSLIFTVKKQGASVTTVLNDVLDGSELFLSLFL
jgi:hypothetical protein